MNVSLLNTRANTSLIVLVNKLSLLMSRRSVSKLFGKRVFKSNQSQQSTKDGGYSQKSMSIRPNAGSALELAAPETVADTALIAAASDGYFTDTNRLMNTLGAALITSKTSTAEVRSLLEFSLAAIPAEAVITQVVLQVELASYQLATGHDWMTLTVYGYTGDGHLTADDASKGSLVGSLTLTSSCRPGAMDLKLTPFFVQKALASGFVGLNLRVSEPVLGSHANYLLLRSAESINANPKPTLVIDYTRHAPLSDTPLSDDCVVSTRITGPDPAADNVVRLFEP